MTTLTQGELKQIWRSVTSDPIGARERTVSHLVQSIKEMERQVGINVLDAAKAYSSTATSAEEKERLVPLVMLLRGLARAIEHGK